MFPQGNAAAHQPALTEELNLEKLEKNAIERALKVSTGNMSKAAELLGITRFCTLSETGKMGLMKTYGYYLILHILGLTGLIIAGV